MGMDELPAVITMGVNELQHGFRRAWRELESGAVVHIMHKRLGRHLGWLVPELPAGFGAEAITCNELRASLAHAFDQVRDGVVFEVRDTQGAQPGSPSEGRVRGYLMLTPPEPIARLDAALQYLAGTRTGRAKLRDIWPLETVAR
jgi:hypothetical protein